MSDDELEMPKELKVVLLGEAGVGKSSIIKQFVNHTFDNDIEPSISSKIKFMGYSWSRKISFFV